MINKYLEKFIEILYEKKNLSENDKDRVEREKRAIYEKGFDKHFVTAIKLLYLLKDNHHQYEIDGPLSTSVILYQMGFIKEDPIISVICEVTEIPLLIKMYYGEEYNKVYKFIEKFLGGDNLLYIYKEKRKEVIERYIPHQGPFVYVFDNTLNKNARFISYKSASGKRCFPYNNIGNIGTKGMYIELKGII